MKTNATDRHVFWFFAKKNESKLQKIEVFYLPFVKIFKCITKHAPINELTK